MSKAITDDSKPELSVLAPLLDKLPPVIARKDVSKFLGGIISSGTLANDDSKCQGPRVRQIINGNICYPTEYLLEYLEHKNARTINVPIC